MKEQNDISSHLAILHSWTSSLKLRLSRGLVFIGGELRLFNLKIKFETVLNQLLASTYQIFCNACDRSKFLMQIITVATVSQNITEFHCKLFINSKY